MCAVISGTNMKDKVKWNMKDKIEDGIGGKYEEHNREKIDVEIYDKDQH